MANYCGYFYKTTQVEHLAMSHTMCKFHKCETKLARINGLAYYGAGDEQKKFCDVDTNSEQFKFCHKNKDLSFYDWPLN